MTKMLKDSPQQDDDPQAARRFGWMLAMLVAMITITVFSVTFSADFVRWDDDVNIYDNPHLRDGVSLNALHWMFTDTKYIPRYMPLGWLSYAVNYQLGGLDPVGYHAGNLLLHGINSLLVFVLLQRLLRLVAGATRREISPIGILVGSAFGALLWAIHPLRAETVAWASSRIYCQALFFLLLSLWAYLRAQETSSAARTRWLSLSVGGFLASLLTYPLALGYVAMLVLLDIYPLRRLGGNWRDLLTPAARRVWLEKIPFAGAVALVLGATLWARTHSGQWAAPATLDQFGFASRAMQSFYVWAHYLWKTVLPLELCPTYTTLVSFNPWSFTFIASAAGIILTTAIVILKIRRRPAVAVLWFGYLVMLVPMLGLTEHPHYTYDRYSYMVAVLISVPLAWWLAVIWSQRPRALVAGASCLVLVTLGILCFQQAAQWRNTPTLLSFISARLGNHPLAAKQELVLGHEYRARGSNQMAELHLRRAIAITPESADAHSALGDILSDQNRFEDAIPAYQEALRFNSNHRTANQNLGVALGSAGRFSEAADQFRTAIRLNTNNASAYHNLARTLARLGQNDEAQLAMAASQRLRVSR